jgi:hypothetical protein
MTVDLFSCLSFSRPPQAASADISSCLLFPAARAMGYWGPTVRLQTRHLDQLCSFCSLAAPDSVLDVILPPKARFSIPPFSSTVLSRLWKAAAVWTRSRGNLKVHHILPEGLF